MPMIVTVVFGMDRYLGRTNELPDRHKLTYESQKLQGKSPGANGGSVQRLDRHSAHSISKISGPSVRNCRDGRPCDHARKCTHEIRETHERICVHLRASAVKK